VVYLDQLTGTADHALTAAHGGMTQVKTGHAKVSRILNHPLHHLGAASVLNSSVFGTLVADSRKFYHKDAFYTTYSIGSCICIVINFEITPEVAGLFSASPLWQIFVD
jgi:hypothetical protein